MPSSLRSGVRSTRIVLVPFLAVLLVLSVSAAGQAQEPYYYRWTLGRWVGGQIGDALSGARDAMAAKAALGAEIRNARRAFWAAYPDGPGLEAAARRFHSALLSKDLHFLSVRLADGGRGSLVAQDRLLGGELDGGIPERARQAFGKWAASVEVASGGAFGRTPRITPELFQGAVLGEDYANYRAVRDMVELFAGPHSPFPEAETPQEQMTASFAYWDLGTPADARAAWAAVDELFGDEATRWVRALMDRAEPPHPYAQFRRPLRQTMEQTDDPAVYRKAGMLLDALAVDGWGLRRLESALAERYSDAEIDDFVRGLIEREGGEGVECGTDLHCFEGIARFLSPAEVLEYLDYQEGVYSMEYHLEAMGDDGRSRLERETAAFRPTLQAWTDRLWEHGLSRRSDYITAAGQLRPDPELVAIGGYQSVNRAWGAVEAIMTFEDGCQNERNDEVRSSLCQIAEIASDYYWGTVGLVRWADGQMAEDERLRNSRLQTNPEGTAANMIANVVNDALRVVRRQGGSDRRRAHAALFVEAGLRALQIRCRDTQVQSTIACHRRLESLERSRELWTPWLMLAPFTTLASGVEREQVDTEGEQTRPMSSASSPGEDGVLTECVMEGDGFGNAGWPPAVTQRPRVINPAEVREAQQNQANGLEGRATFVFFLEETGVVREIRLLESSGSRAVDMAACRVALTYKFSPALQMNQTVETWVSVPVDVGR